MDDAKDKEKISITTKKGSRLVLDDGGETLTFADKDGKNGITVALKNGEITKYVNASNIRRFVEERKA